MAKRKDRERTPRGIRELPPGSDNWWADFYLEGKRYRKNVGRRSDAIAYLQKAKADARRGRLLPELQPKKPVTVGELVDDVLEFTRHHKDEGHYWSKAAVVKSSPLAERPAADVTPQEVTRFLDGLTKKSGRGKNVKRVRVAPATYNRYRAFLQLVWTRGMANRKVQLSPVHQKKVAYRKEDNWRIIYLTRNEYERLYKAIAQKQPEHLASFVVSVHTGMRLSEQFTVTWSQVHFDRKTIELTQTKNGDERTVHLNIVALEALKSLKKPGQKRTDRVFPVYENNHENNFDYRSWFNPCLKEAGISEEYTWHGNRHTFCSWLAMADASTRQIQEAAGHKTLAMAARYAHLSPSHRLSVVEWIALPHGADQE
jgi:integrase